MRKKHVNIRLDQSLTFHISFMLYILAYLGELKCFIVAFGQNKELNRRSKVTKFLKEPSIE